jgi:hypothetical protein
MCFTLATAIPTSRVRSPLAIFGEGLHPDVAVSAKVQGVDGKWRALDMRVLHAMAVSASETYNTAVEDELRTRLGGGGLARSRMHIGFTTLLRAVSGGRDALGTARTFMESPGESRGERRKVTI